MKIVLHKITKGEEGLLDFAVSFGDDPPKDYQATYASSSDGKYRVSSVDEELFMTLSSLAIKRFGNCVVYQMELHGILAAFNEGDKLPELPAELGTTSFCTLRPGFWRIVWNKFNGLLYRIRVLQP